MALAHRVVRADPANGGPLPPSTSCTSLEAAFGAMPRDSRKSSRAEARTRAVRTAAVRFESGSTVVRVDDGGRRFRNPSLSTSLSAEIGDASHTAQKRKR